MIRNGVLALAGLLALAVLVVNSFLIGPSLNVALSGIQERSGTEGRFDQADGNVLTGALRVNGLELKREVENRNAFQLRVGHATANLSVLRLNEPEWHLDSLHLAGVTGAFTVVSRPREARPVLAGGNVFLASQVTIDKADLDFQIQDRHGQRQMKLEVDQLKVTDYRSRWSLFDILFRSRGGGKVEGQGWSLMRLAEGEALPGAGAAEGEGSEGEATDSEATDSQAAEGAPASPDTVRIVWQLDGVPAGLVSPSLQGPLSWITHGAMTATVVSSWPKNDPRTIHQVWDLRYDGLGARAPADVSAAERAANAMMLRFLAGNARDLHLQFECDLPRDRFDGAESLDDAGLWPVVSEAAGKALGEQAMGSATRGLGSLGDRVRSIFGQ